jgi:DNA topoisomerase-1
VDDSAIPDPMVPELNCPTCGKPMVRKEGADGPCFVCSGYPECYTAVSFGAEAVSRPFARPTEHTCEKCGKPMVLRQSRRGLFLGCSDYPRCRHVKRADDQGNPV